MKKAATDIIVMSLILTATIIFLFGRGFEITGSVVSEIAEGRISSLESSEIESALSRVNPEITQKFKDEDKIQVIVHYREDKRENSLTSRTRGIEKDYFTPRGYLAEVGRAELALIALDPNVENIEPERYFDLALSDSVEIVGAVPTWDLEVNGKKLTGEGETVCVIDTGIDFSHPDLQSKNILGCNLYCVGQPCQLDCSQTDLNGHGTHVAGIVAASGTSKGVAPGANLIGLKVFSGASGTGTTTSNVQRAIDWCVNNAENYNISVITISISSSNRYNSCCDSSFFAFSSSIGSAFNKNISVTAATGNNRDFSAIASPSCICAATPISSTNKDSSFASSYANVAPFVKLAAPGTDIISTCAGGGTCQKSGTSMSTPMAAGSIAIANQYLKEIGESRTPREIEEIFRINGLAVQYPSSVVPPLQVWRINLISAILDMDKTSPEVNLNSPENTHSTPFPNVEFECSAEDWQLSELNLYLWKNGEIVEINESEVSGTQNSSVFSKTFSESGEYEWNCLAIDARENQAFAQENFTITVGGERVVELLSPENASNLNTSPVLNCRVSLLFEEIVDKTNVYVWNENGEEVFSESVMPEEITNSFEFEFETFLESSGRYYWNCESDLSGEQKISASENFTFFFDGVSPIISLIYPENAAEFLPEDMPMSLEFSVIEEFGKECRVKVNNEILEVIEIENGGNFSIEKDFVVGNYIWSVECEDFVGNVGESENRTFFVEDESGTSGEDSGGSGGSGGGSGNGGGAGGGGGSGGLPNIPSAGNVITETPQENEPIVPEKENDGDTLITGRAINDILGNRITFVGGMILALILLGLIAFFVLRRNKKRKK